MSEILHNYIFRESYLSYSTTTPLKVLVVSGMTFIAWSFVYT